MFLSRRMLLVAPACMVLDLTFDRSLAQPATTITGRPPLDYSGVYRFSDGHVAGIERFVSDAGLLVLLYTDYETSMVRQLQRVSQAEFRAAAPGDLSVTFLGDSGGKLDSIRTRWADGREASAQKQFASEEDVAFRNDDATLSGRLIVPASSGPHPAIVLLHGSGPLTRYSFGPYPRFFQSLGFAVLIYDKRGTGASTGQRLDVSTWMLNRSKYYPEDIAGDARAAVEFLQRRSDIDARRIGVWGSSEGGMLATHVAARAPNVAFAINSSGFMGPLWQTMEYQVGAQLRTRNLSGSELALAHNLFRLWVDVARGGRGYETYLQAHEAMLANGRAWPPVLSRRAMPLEQLRWMWDHMISFNSLPDLLHVRCPVMGLFGADDTVTDAQVAAAAMRRKLVAAGNRNVATHIFADAGHSLMETPSGARMAPGVFDTLSEWLKTRYLQ